MRRLLLLLACAALTAAARAADAPPPHAQLASFADMVRLAAAAPLAREAAPAHALRVTLAPPLPAEPRFSVRAAPGPQRWLLLFSGLALAGWVAHRRLVNAL